MNNHIRTMTALVSAVKNPTFAVLDRLKLHHTPYQLRLRNGQIMELRPATGDLFGFYEIVLRGDYFSGGQILSPGATVVDVGANIGCFAITAARIVGPKGRVIAVEPEESTYQQLVRNISLNQLQNVIPLRAAVGASEGEILLRSDPNKLFSSVFTSVNGRAIDGVEQRVPLLTLSSLLEKFDIQQCDYLKLDCEGAEHEIIASMSNAIAERVQQMTMEIHKVPGHDGKTLSRRLESLGYRRVGTSTLPFYNRIQ